MLELILCALKGTGIALLSSLFTKRFLLKMIRTLGRAYVKSTKNTVDDEWWNEFEVELNKQIEG